MEFSSFENGLNSNIIRSSRKDWTLAHDVALLKHLENFSLSLISKTDAALRSLEEFESDINSVCLHIKAISHKCQSLADKQFIEHRVQEDDVTTYVKKKENPVIEKSGTSKSDLSTALISCLSALHSKYEKIHLQGVGSSDNNSSQVVITPVSRYDERFLPPFLGTEEFCNYYSQKSSRDLNEKLSKLNSVPQFSDKMSMQDSSSVSSSNFTFDEDDDNLIKGNRNPSIHSTSCENSANIPIQSNDDDSNSTIETTNQEVKPLSSSEDIIGHLTMAHVRRRRIQMEKERGSLHKEILPPILSGSSNEERSTIEDFNTTAGPSETVPNHSNHTIPPYDPFYAIRPTNTQKPQSIFDDSSDSDDLFTSDNHVPFSQKIFSDKMPNNNNSDLFSTTDSLFAKKVEDYTKPGKSNSESVPPLPDQSHLGSPKVKMESNFVSNKLHNNFTSNAHAAGAPLNHKISNNTSFTASPVNDCNDTTDNCHKDLFSTRLPSSNENKEFSLFPDSYSSSDEDDLFCPVKESRNSSTEEVSPSIVLPKRNKSKSPDLLDLLLPKRKGIDSLYKSFPAPLDDINTFYSDKPLFSPKKVGKLSTIGHINEKDHQLPSKITTAHVVSSSHKKTEKPSIPSVKLPVKPKPVLQGSNLNRNTESPRTINASPRENMPSVNTDKQTPGKLTPERYLNINPSSLMGHIPNTKKLQEEKEKINDGNQILSNNEILPSFKTEILTNVVKSRVKIVSKRRLPSRKHLRDLSSNEENDSSKDLKVSDSQNNCLPGPLNEPSVLSPSTDEEDLFTVPPSLPPREISCSNLFSDSSLLSPGTSVDSQNINDFESKIKEEPLHKSPLKIIEHYNISKEEMSQILKNPILNKNNLLFESSKTNEKSKTVSKDITSNHTIHNSATFNQHPVLVDRSTVLKSSSPPLFSNSSSVKSNQYSPSFDKPSTSIDNRLPAKPKTTLTTIFHDSDKEKKSKQNVDLFLHTSEQNTLFNNIDSEDDEDYLFSDVQPLRSKFYKPTKNNANEETSTDGFTNNPELFTDLFGDSDGDDDDLFNVKKTPLLKVSNNNNVNPHVNTENNFYKVTSASPEDSFGKNKSSLTKQTDFMDPLGIHLNHQTD